jgi:mRNA interferase MazF
VAGGAKAGKSSYVLCHQPKSFDWRVHLASPHPMKRLGNAPFAEACAVLNQIVALA